jgi:starch phosphorylase
MPDPQPRSSTSTDAGIAALTELALDLRSTWYHGADELWMQLDPELWSLTHNAWVVLQTVSRATLHALLAQADYRERLESIMERRRQYLAASTWFPQAHPGAPLTCVAYFSLEYALSEALPVYAGGLGNVAGDQLKAANDLGVPVVGIGLLYQQGYFRQVIGPDGAQEALYPYNEPAQLPIQPVREASGELLRLDVQLPGRKIWLRAWRAQVARAVLYLLDSNDPANPPAVRGITSELYGGGLELRLRQELILGIVGWRLLRALDLEPEVCHLNEGHAAFVVLERARTFMEATGVDFETALTVTRAGNLFTTHTPVPAGFDRFPPALIERYLGRYVQEHLRIDRQRLLALGRAHPDDPDEPFSMAHLAIHGSGAINGVSRLHGQVSRRIFVGLFPDWPQADVPVGHVTNGVHAPSWDSEEADTFWTRACGRGRWLGTLDTMEASVTAATDAELWEMRLSARRALVDYLRDRMAQQWPGGNMRHLPRDEDARPALLTPDALTLGFARRFATYKRPNLLLYDPDRLLRILDSRERPVQLVIAGKAHPADALGQAMITEWIQFTRRPEASGRVIFVPDYDLVLAARLVQGVDLWLNTPRRPWEASGTSGMKVLVNGGLNLSELDGWWAEAYSPEVGWALGDGQEHGDDPAWDVAEANELYRLLEDEVVPAFYTRDANGIPSAWVAKMRASMSRLTPRFSTNRVVREYTETYYLPAVARYRARAADRGARGRALLEWRRRLAAHWHEARFGARRWETAGGEHHAAVELHLGGLDADEVRVELYADPVGDGPAERHPMTRTRRLPGSVNGHEYVVRLPAARDAGDYTARLVPSHPDAIVPLEAREIAWQRP